MSEPKSSVSNDQILDWFSSSVESENERMDKAPPLFKKGEGVDEVPNEIDDEDE